MKKSNNLTSVVFICIFVVDKKFTMQSTAQYSLPEENGPGLLRYLNLDIPLHNVYDFIELSRNGINKRNLLFLAKKIDFDLKELSKVLHISERTLQRYTPCLLYTSPSPRDA